MIRNQQAHLIYHAASHPGMTGKQNEDRFGVTAFLGGWNDRTPSVLAVLCDGIGGHRAGEVAAEMGVSLITESVGAEEPDKPLRTLEKAIHRASEAIYHASQTDQGRVGMGATCACAWVIGDRLYTANLGDSRIYLLRKGHFLQLSTDHTWVQEAIDAGLISEETIGNHPNAHVIRRYLGSKEMAEPDFRLWYFAGEDDEAALENQGLRLRRGDMLLLCSDGLTDLVADSEIQTLLETHPLENAPEALIGMANERGGHDNITVVLLQVPRKGNGWFGRKRKRQRTIGCVTALVVLALLVGGALIGRQWWRKRLQGTETPSQAATVEVSPTEEPWTSTPSLFPTATPTAENEDREAETPQPSITPWPTDTVSP
jgi:protein phosphatase